MKEKERLKVKYNAYLLEEIFADMDEVIDMGPPMSFEEFCKMEANNEQRLLRRGISVENY